MGVARSWLASNGRRVRCVGACPEPRRSANQRRVRARGAAGAAPRRERNGSAERSGSGDGAAGRARAGGAGRPGPAAALGAARLRRGAAGARGGRRGARPGALRGLAAAAARPGARDARGRAPAPRRRSGGARRRPRGAAGLGQLPGCGAGGMAQQGPGPGLAVPGAVPGQAPAGHHGPVPVSVCPCPCVHPGVRVSIPVSICPSVRVSGRSWPRPGLPGRYLEKLLQDSVAPAIRASSAHLQSFTFTRVDLGQKPLRVLGVQAHPGTHKKQILLDLNISYVGDVQIDVEVKKFFCKAGVKGMQLHGVLRIILEPLLGDAPIVGRSACLHPPPDAGHQLDRNDQPAGHPGAQLHVGLDDHGQHRLLPGAAQPAPGAAAARPARGCAAALAPAQGRGAGVAGGRAGAALQGSVPGRARPGPLGPVRAAQGGDTGGHQQGHRGQPGPRVGRDVRVHGARGARAGAGGGALRQGPPTRTICWA
ncbi:extended synaptotagmin-1, partial [Agelaius phoeniceus]|uniref:extended synaptotagmin-1 n=1 Tax=Agelaius phoeniceus TaxID=39638 RepID=UPI0040552611